MRINSATKQYITKLIAEKADSVRKPLEEKLHSLEEENEKKVADKKDSYNAEIKKVEADCIKAVKSIMKKYDVHRETRWNGNLREPEINIYHSEFHFTNALYNKIVSTKKRIEEIDQKVKDSTVEIIAKMSLGGDVDTLKTLIAELKF